jgi:hypothetical protein
MYRLTRKLLRRRSPQSTGDAASPRPLPQDEAGDSAVGDANPATLRSV